MALSSGETLEPSDFGDAEQRAAHDELPPTALASPTAAANSPAEIPRDLQTYLDDQERQVLLKALKEADFNRTAAAARLGLNLRQMRYRIQRLGIAMPSDAEPDDSDAS
jgi:two-component system response regulator PilR (NtrC family)